jgi:hypothetical protein
MLIATAVVQPLPDRSLFATRQAVADESLVIPFADEPLTMRLPLTVPSVAVPLSRIQAAAAFVTRLPVTRKSFDVLPTKIPWFVVVPFTWFEDTIVPVDPLTLMPFEPVLRIVLPVIVPESELLL